MSVCAPCQKTKPIPKCVVNLLIGGIAFIDTVVTVYFKDISTGKLTGIITEVGGDGSVFLENLDCGFMPDHSYEVWVTFAGNNIEDRLTLTISDDYYPTIGREHECLAVRFIDAVDCAGEQIDFTTYTIEIAE